MSADLSAYQALFDEFIHERGLDIDDDTWPLEAQTAWADRYAAFTRLHE